MIVTKNGEEVLRQDSCEVKKFGEGRLYLTTQRIVFESQRGLVLPLPINKIDSVTIVKSPLGPERLIINFMESESKTKPYKIRLYNIRPRQWLGTFIGVTERLKTPIPTSTIRGQPPSAASSSLAIGKALTAESSIPKQQPSRFEKEISPIRNITEQESLVDEPDTGRIIDSQQAPVPPTVAATARKTVSDQQWIIHETLPDTAGPLIGRLLDMHLIRRKLARKIAGCPVCQGPNVVVSFLCQQCGSKDVFKTDSEGGQSIFCGKCGFAGTVFHIYFCGVCQSEFTEPESMLVDYYSYELTKEVAQRASQDIGPLISFFKDAGYIVVNPAIIKGRSGVSHPVDILAYKEGDPRAGVAVNVVWSDRPADEMLIFRQITILRDVEVGLGILVAIPGLTGPARNFVESSGVRAVEVSGSVDIIEKIEGVVSSQSKVELISWGVEALDVICGGGLVRGKAYLLNGPPDQSRAAFSAAFLKSGETSNENCLLVYLDKQSYAITDLASKVGFKLRTDDRSSSTGDKGEGRTATLDLVSETGEVGISFARTIANLTLKIAKAVSEHSATRLVLDGFDALLVPGIQKRIPIRNQLDSLARLDCTILATSSIGLGFEEYLVSGVLVIEKNSDTLGKIQVRRMDGLPYDPNPHSFGLEKSKGLLVALEEEKIETS